MVLTVGRWYGRSGGWVVAEDQQPNYGVFSQFGRGLRLEERSPGLSD